MNEKKEQLANLQEKKYKTSQILNMISFSFISTPQSPHGVVREIP